jgi:hypothetical protein
VKKIPNLEKLFTGFCRKFCSWLNPVEKTEQAYAANE